MAHKLTFAILFACSTALAADAPDLSKLPPAATRKVDFKVDVLPIFTIRCVSCHDAKKLKGGLRLDQRAAFLRGGDNGKVIAPNDSAKSKLIHMVAGLDEDDIMPPKGDPLTKAQVGVLRAWIDQGASWPDELSNDNEKKHWAYEKPARTAPPAVSPKHQAFVKSPIDAFIIARLEKEGLTPSPESDRAMLLRRVSLDITGLPPTLAEVDAFVADKSADAYEKAVDRLLQSPAYGERWAKVWLDLARYADTQGYEKDNRRTIWRYRDWVIDAYDRNMPFDQFTIEQLAGDLLPGASVENQVATAFHRNTMTNTEGGTDNEEFRTYAVVDRVSTTWQVWMGTTFGCAQCHTHKYDPFTQREYYQFYAFLNNTADADNDNEAPFIETPSIDQLEQQAKLAAKLAALKAKLDATPNLAAEQAAWEKSLGEVKEAWTVQRPTSMIAKSGATLTAQADGAVLVTGKQADVDVYTVKVKTRLAGITGIRLEALPDDKLPGIGPGRTPHGNFVLTELRLEADGKEVKLQNGTASHAQGNFPASAAVDGTAIGMEGWAIAPNLGKANTAWFENAADVGSVGKETELTFTLHQTYGSQHALGKFRLALTGMPRPVKPGQSIPENILAIVKVEPAKRSAKQKDEIAAYFRTIAPATRELQQQIGAVEKQIADIKPTTTPVLRELPAAQSRKTHILVRGSFMNKGEEVGHGVPMVMNPLPKDAPLNRLTMAKWIVSPENPLTARVTVNRLWEQLFGLGIVETVEDFGTQGTPPSHPQLLDWLATEFIRLKWDQKAMLKTMVMSATYRQTAKATPQHLATDAKNELLARGPRFRLDAETVRDQALAVSGLLSTKMYGPSVFPPQPEGVWNVVYSGDAWQTSPGEDRYRRGLYTFWRRTSPYPSMIAFDAGSREVCMARRVRTNTPLAALVTLNDPVYVEAAQALARKIISDGGSNAEDRARYAFRRVMSRQPSAAEVDRIVKAYQAELEHYTKNPAEAVKIATQPLGAAPQGANVAELAAWTVVGNVLLNLDEALSK